MSLNTGINVQATPVHQGVQVMSLVQSTGKKDPPVHQGVQAMSLVPSTNTRTEAMASPRSPLAGPDNSDLSMTRLLSPASSHAQLEKDMESLLEKSLSEIFDSPEAATNMATGSNPPTSHMPSCPSASQQPATLSNNNNKNIPDQGEAARQTQGSEMLSARRNIASEAMDRATTTPLTETHSTQKPSYGPAAAEGTNIYPNGPYRPHGPYVFPDGPNVLHANLQPDKLQTRESLAKENEIYHLKQQVHFLTEQSTQKDEWVQQKWDEKNISFQEHATRYKQVAHDEHQVLMADLTVKAKAELMQKDQMIVRLQERLNGVQNENMQSYQAQQKAYDEDNKAQAVVYEQKSNIKMQELIIQAQKEHNTDKQDFEKEARQIIENQQLELVEMQNKARERMHAIHDDAQRTVLQKDEQIVQLQYEKQQLEAVVLQKSEETHFYQQNHDQINSELEKARHLPSLQLVQDLQTRFDVAQAQLLAMSQIEGEHQEEYVKQHQRCHDKFAT